MKRNTKICSNCNKKISLSNYKRHIKSCSFKKYSIDNVRKIKISETEFKCIYCKNDKIYSKNGIISHVWRMHGTGKKHNSNIGFEKKIRKQWNSGLTKDTDKRVKENGITIQKSLKRLYAIGKLTPTKLNKKSRKKLSIKASLNNKGGKCKWYSYKKKNGKIVKLQGTWELRFAKVLDTIDSNWIKPTESNHSFNWIDKKGKEHTYTPDFYSPKLNKYFEIKGFWWGNDKDKMKRVITQNKIDNIEIVEEKQLLKYEKSLDI